MFKNCLMRLFSGSRRRVAKGFYKGEPSRPALISEKAALVNDLSLQWGRMSEAEFVEILRLLRGPDMTVLRVILAYYALIFAGMLEVRGPFSKGDIKLSRRGWGFALYLAGLRGSYWR